ncbi:fructose-6-phosphate aldolase [Candidatus Gracilibacteria bacterium]|nr:fructose-6-phosphate aldolase [Candidatus Gracilibacteria bacterium]
MKLFLDSADLSLITKYSEYGIVDGVTTNPTIIAKEGADQETRIREIAEIVHGPVSAEVTTLTAEEMIEQGRKIASWGDNIYVKLPIIPEGLKALKVLSAEGIPTNMTLCFSLSQAWAVAKLGATLVSPFIGRLDDRGEDGVKLVEDIVSLYRLHGYETAVLAASIRSVEHIRRCALVGADIITLPPKLIDEMLQDDLTDAGLAKFMEDFHNSQK